MKDDTDFTGKAVLVVGGSSGIGNGIAHGFRARGAAVHVWGTRAQAADYDPDDGSDLAGLGYSCVDVGDPDAIEAAAMPFDRLDVLILCQGTVVYRRGEFEREGWDRVMAVNLDSLRPGKAKWFLPMYLGFNVVLGVLLVLVPEFRRYGFAGVIAAVVATEGVLRRRGLRDWPLQPLFVAIALQAVAFVIWNLDRTHLVCDPTLPIQGHAVWHALGALAAYALWRYFRKSSS